MVAAASFGGMVFYCIHGFFEDIIWIPEVMIPFWILAALPYVVEMLPSKGSARIDGGIVTSGMPWARHAPAPQGGWPRALQGDPVSGGERPSREGSSVRRQAAV
jgi:hypothetical protein